jgi:hypothetical protein
MNSNLNLLIIEFWAKFAFWLLQVKVVWLLKNFFRGNLERKFQTFITYALILKACIFSILGTFWSSGCRFFLFLQLISLATVFLFLKFSKVKDSILGN